MEDVLEVYTRPYEERFPQVCPDEKGKRLVSEAQEPLAAKSSIDWRFTSADARIKLEHLYPEIVEEPSYDPNLP